jgi:STE24 endopeptidase
MLFKPAVQYASPANTKAKQYDTINNWFFLARILFAGAILALYHVSGASVALANGLRASFGGNWLAVNAVYILISIFGFTALLFPLSYYTEHVLENHYDITTETFGEWLGNFIQSLLLDLVLGLVFFETIYTLLHYAPETWWVWATLFYIAFGIVLSALFPTLIMPLFNTFEPLKNGPLAAKVTAMLEQAGIKTMGVYSWGIEEKNSPANAAFTGLGKTKRIILSATLLKEYSDEQILAILAHEIGHYKNRDTQRLFAVSSVMAILGFWIAHLLLQQLVTRLGFTSAADIASMPLFLFALMIFSLVSMPLSNGYSRKREYAADRYAVETTGDIEAFATALEKLTEQNLTDKEPHPLIELMLHSHPSLKRRIAAVRESRPN